MGMVGEHAPLPPSAASRWGPDGCAASATWEALYPEDEDSPEAREGTAAHHYLAEVAAGRTVTIGELAPNGIPITQEMADCAFDVLLDITSTVKSNGDADALRIENKVSAAATVHPDNWGTPDAYLLVRPRRKLHVWDYKYGHRYVDAFGNWQCLDYAAAILESEGIPYEDWPNWSITITIAQPRNYHPDGPLREWHLNGAQLVERIERLRVAAAAARAPNPPLQTGEHCRDCNARHACPALEAVAMMFVDMSMTAQPVELTPKALGLELKIIRAAMKRLGARATGLEEELLAVAKRGGQTPFWRAEYSMGREKFRDDAPIGELVTLGELYGVVMLKPPATITPAQAVKAGVDAEVIKAYAHKPRGAMTLVPFDETDIAKRFS